MSASRLAVNTPALMLDLDALEANIALMASRCRSRRIDLRPHVKSHKSSRIARMQIETGAIGVSCATVDEAEVMAAVGMPGILITSPIVSEDKMRRVIAAARAVPDLMVVADDATNARSWDRLAGGLVGRLSVLVDLDVGQHRSGVTTNEAAISLARQIAGSKHLAFAGMQAYAGHVQHIVSRSSRAERAKACARRTRDAVQALVSAGLRPRIVTGGGTGTHGIEPDLGVLTEIQPGSYVLMDVEYEGIDLRHEDQTQFRPSLFVQTTVISRNVPRFVQTDAGTKAFALNGPLPEIIRGAPAGSAYNYLGDEHGQIKLPPGASPPRLGDRVECLTPHCDPTVHLYDHYNCVRGDRLIGRWPIDARGRK